MIAACVAWSAGCASTPRPMVDPYYASGAYAPARIAVLPPDIFVVLDQFGDNDAVKSAALGAAVTNETVKLVEQTLRARGYDVDLSARWDGIVGQDGSVLVNRDELGGLANGVLQFANGQAGGGHGTMTQPQFVAPDLAGKVGWATQSDALLYVNVKGVTTTNGKRTASILAGVFIVVIVVGIVALLAAQSKGGGSGNSSALNNGGSGGGFRGQPVARAAPSGGGFHGVPLGGRAAAMPSGSAGGGTTSALSSGRAGMVGGASPHAATLPGGNAGGRAATLPGGNAAPSTGGLTPGPSGGWHGTPPGSTAAAAPPPVAGGWRAGAPSGGVAAGGGGWRGGAAPARPAGAPVYYGGGSNVHFGVGVWVPLGGPVHTHEGNVAHEDAIFAGDEIYVSMTLVSTYDGRVLWHAREHLDLDAEDNRDVDRMVQSFLGSLPPRGGKVAVPAPK